MTKAERIKTVKEAVETFRKLKVVVGELHDVWDKMPEDIQHGGHPPSIVDVIPCSIDEWHLRLMEHVHEWELVLKEEEEA